MSHPLEGELVLYHGKPFLCVGIDEERGDADLHELNDFEQALVAFEITQRVPFNGLKPGVWLANKVTRMMN